MSGFAAAVPSLNDGIHGVHPRHRNRIAADEDNGRPGVGRHEGADHFILTVREFQPQPVLAFAVLILGLIKTADEEDDIRLCRFRNSLRNQFLRTPAFAQVLPGGNAIVGIVGAADITADPLDAGASGLGPLGNADERVDLVLGLEGRTAAPDNHTLDGVLAHDEDLLRLGGDR